MRKQKARNNHQGGNREERQKARWENTASKTEGRKERRVMREEERADEKEKKRRLFRRSLFPQCLLTHERCRDECAECAQMCVSLRAHRQL